MTKQASVHLADYPKSNSDLINNDLEEQMHIAQLASSMVLSLRKKVNIKVRQPLNKIMIPILTPEFKGHIEKVESLILKETNVKSIEYVLNTSGIITKKIKPNFKILGPKHGQKVKLVAGAISSMGQQEIEELEAHKNINLNINGENITITIDEVDVVSEDIPGWLVENKGELTVALDINLSDELKQEGIARELVNRIQNLRKQQNLNVTDRINIKIERKEWIESAIYNHKEYICSEILAEELILSDNVENPLSTDINETEIKLEIRKT